MRLKLMSLTALALALAAMPAQPVAAEQSTSDATNTTEQTDEASPPSNASDTDGDMDVGQQDADDKDADQQTGSDDSDDSNASIVAAPPGYTWSLDVGYGSSIWRSPTGSAEPRANPRLGATYRITDLWSGSLRLDWSRQKTEAGPLTFDNQHWRLLAGGGVTYWVNAIHMELHLQGGALLKNAVHRSPGTDDISANVIRPTFGGTAALGVGFFKRVVLSLTGGAHWSAPARLDPFYGVRLSTALGTQTQQNQ